LSLATHNYTQCEYVDNKPTTTAYKVMLWKIVPDD